MFQHVSCCDRLRKGEYLCHEHRAAERFLSFGTPHLLKSLSSPAQLCKRVQTKVHDKALLTRTMTVLRNLGPKRQRKSTSSPSSSPPISPLLAQLHELGGTEMSLTPELGGAELLELPDTEMTCSELYAGEFPAELMAGVPIQEVPQHQSNNSLHNGMDLSQSSSPSIEASTLPWEPATTESNANGFVSTSSRFLEQHSWLHTFPSNNPLSGHFDTRQEYSDLVSPISSLSTYGDERSSTIDASGDPNSRKLSGHFPSCPVSPLDSDGAANSAYSARALVPAWISSVPNDRPLTPKQLEGVAAAKQSYPTPINNLYPRANPENAHLLESSPQHSPPLRDGHNISRLLSNPPADIGALAPKKTSSGDQSATTAEVYQGNFNSFGEHLPTMHHGQHVDKTLGQSTTLVYELDAVTSVVADTELRLRCGRLRTVPDVVLDLYSGAAVRPSGCLGSITILTVYRHTLKEQSPSTQLF